MWNIWNRIHHQMNLWGHPRASCSSAQLRHAHWPLWPGRMLAGSVGSAQTIRHAFLNGEQARASRASCGPLSTWLPPSTPFCAGQKHCRFWTLSSHAGDLSVRSSSRGREGNVRCAAALGYSEEHLELCCTGHSNGEARMYTIDEGKSKLLCKFSVGTGTVSSLLWKEDERILFCGTTHGISPCTT